MGISCKAEQDLEASSTAPLPSPGSSPFQAVDWLALAVTVALIGLLYFFTLAPEVTLKDSGELVTAAYYGGVPHPPGYPIWTMYSRLWTALLPVGNIAWRVEVGN